MPDSPTRTLVMVPTYNECENAPKLVKELLALGLNLDLLFVDDGSPDGTGDLLDALAADDPRVHVLHRPCRMGIGGAHLAGIDWAYVHGYKDLVTMDCDFTHPPEKVPEVLALAAEDPGLEVIVGSRFMEKDSLPGWNLLRRSLTWAGHAMTRGLLGMPFDATGGFRYYRLGRIPPALFEKVQARGYAFFFESLHLLSHNGFKILEVPICLPARTLGSSKMSLLEAQRSVALLFRIAFRKYLHPEEFKIMVALGPESGEASLHDGQGADGYGTDRLRGFLDRVEFGVALVLTIALVVVHISVWMHSGPLWRDEVNSENIALLPGFSAIGHALWLDSVPILWIAVLRGWNALGFVGHDPGLRLLGLGVGLGLLSALWWNARRLGGMAPLVSLVLFASCLSLLRAGDSLRGYGFGTLLLLVTFGLVWRVLNRPTLVSTAVACLFAVLSVQTLYHNVILMGILGLSGALTAVRSRAWKALFCLACVEAAAALSMLPYLGTVVAIQSYSALVKGALDLDSMAQFFSRAMGPMLTWMAVLVWVAAAGSMALRLFLRPEGGRGRPDDLAFFLGLNLVAGIPLYVVFLLSLGYSLHPWYFFSIVAFLAVVAEAALGLAIRDLPWARWVRLGLVSAVGLGLWNGLWQGAMTRSSGIDQVAEKLQGMASKDDLVVVSPWYMGVSFARYYHGTSPWISLPDLTDHRTHRYDQIKLKMLTPDPVARELAHITATLQAGHRVWVVGLLEGSPEGEIPTSLPPPAGASAIGNEGPYRSAWARQMTYLLIHHSRSVRQYVFKPGQPINIFENPSLYLAEGWKAL